MDVVVPPRLFSLREADALVPTLQRTFARARELRERLTLLQGELARAGHEAKGPRIEVDPAAPRAVRELQQRAGGVVAELLEALRGVSDLGAEVKAAEGLVDFRSRLEGRVVYLCWRYGEDRVAHWHELDAGFAGRQPLPEGAEFTGDLLH